MKRKYIFLVHLAYWLMYLLLLLIIISIVFIQSNQKPSFFAVLFLSPIGILCLFPNLPAFYAFYLFLFPKFLQRKKITSLIIYGTVACLLSALLGSLALYIQFHSDKPVFRDLDQFFSLVIWMSLVAAIHGGIALVIRGFITWYGEIKLKEQLSEKNYEMELALIKSQFNPHFLFNTINNIDVLITRDTAKASEYLNKLSGILRYMLYETKTEKISLTKELTYIEKYLELQKIRTSNPNYVSYEVTGNANNLVIAPMIFFPFIENAFKHTENKKSDGAITIKILIDQKNLIFDCQNTHQKNFQIREDYGGLGDELIRKRLMLLYPDRHSLEIEKGKQSYMVKLSLILDEN